MVKCVIKNAKVENEWANKMNNGTHSHSLIQIREMKTAKKEWINCTLLRISKLIMDIIILSFRRVERVMELQCSFIHSSWII